MYSHLQKNKIYKAIYKIKNEDFYTFIKINEDDLRGTDIFTEEQYKLKELSSIVVDYAPEEYKHALKLYNVYKNKNIFKIETPENSIINNNLNYILRYFEIKNYNSIFENFENPDDLEKFIIKFKNYFGKYVDLSELLVYTNQIKNFKNLNEMLMFVPKEFLSKKIPFWLSIFKNYYPTNNLIFCFSLYDIALCNKFGLNLMDFINKRDEFLKQIEYKKEQDLNFQIENYVIYYKGLLIKRIEDSLRTLNNEKFKAQKENDNDLIFEISIIEEEINKIHKNINLIDFLKPNFWPDILLPDPSKEFENDESNNYILENLKYLNFDVFDLNTTDII
jgi:hypothetical protein